MAWVYERPRTWYNMQVTTQKMSARPIHKVWRWTRKWNRW